MSKENIINRIRSNKPIAVELPKINKNDFSSVENLFEAFTKNSEAAGGKVIITNGLNEAAAIIESLLKESENAISLVDEFKYGTINLNEETSAKSLNELDAVILMGQFGVAENGAVWIPGNSLPQLVIPFITKHLFLLLRENKIVENMHEAYEQIVLKDNSYGVFISGPSKTADIEQSLVIGAQGPLSTTVILIRNSLTNNSFN